MAINAIASTKGLAEAQWHELRRRGIGGSDAAAVAGFNPWKSKVGVYLEKTGQVEPQIAGEAAYWGNQMEDVVAKEFSKRTGLKVKRSNILYRHPEHQFMLGNIDRLITDNGRKGILECKTASAFLKDDWIIPGTENTDFADRVPDHYMIQLQHYLKTLELDFGFFAVLIGGNTFKMKYVERDNQMIDYLIKLESEFWNNHITKGIPPMMDGTDASTNLLNYLYPTSKPESIIQLSSEAETLIDQIAEAQKEVKAAELKLDTAKNQIKSMMEDNEIAMYGGEKVFTWKSSERTSIDSKALKSKQPEIYEQYSKTTPVRTFLVK
jgi:putative phage-type endonuclease